MSNRSGRYETLVREDWEGRLDGGLQASPRTTLARESCRTILATNRSPDVPFEQSINPYRGCEHGCIYCYARPTHAWLGLSPGLDFETRLFFKPDAPELLRKELARPGYRCKPVALGANTDPYQPVERRLGLTRRILEVLDASSHPVLITTKSKTVERDIDILASMACRNLVTVGMSFTTLNAELARKLEPRATAPERRMDTLRRLSAAGVPASVLIAPVIPVLTDGELEQILERAAAAGARDASYVLLRLPLEIRELFEEWLQVHRPGQAARVMNRVRETRGGKAYDPGFGKRMRGEGVYADMIQRRFAVASRKLGLGDDIGLDCSRFRPPSECQAQLELL